MAYGVLISAGIGIGFGLSTLANAPVFSTVGGGVGFGSALTFTQFISYEGLYKKHSHDKKSLSDIDLKDYGMNVDSKNKIPSPSFKIKECVENLFMTNAGQKSP